MMKINLVLIEFKDGMYSVGYNTDKEIIFIGLVNSLKELSELIKNHNLEN